jgi:exonuclease SbcD
MFKFIHAADTHIDSRLLGLAAYEGAPVEKLRGASRDAFANLVSLAIEEEVAFVIIAGDLFDGQWEDMRTGLWTAGQFRRLARANIPVYLIRGNHDAASKVRARIDWPKNDVGEEIVREFSVRKAETFTLPEPGVAIHGRGFAHQEAPDDLAQDYPEPVDSLFNIGVLHTSLSGDANHDTYAPTTVETLVNKGYDYWALGHIHQRKEFRQEPRIEYPGNTQGRHAKETGAKGCLLVTVDEGEIAQVDFRPTDVLRWHREEITLNEADRLPEMYDQVRRRLETVHESDDGRFTAARLTIRGACAAHDQLVRKGQRDEAIAQIRNLANDIDEVWIEKIALDTSPPVDVEQLRKGGDLLGDLLRHVSETSKDDGQLTELAGTFQPLVDKAARELNEAEVGLDDADQLRRWLKQAEALLVSRLTEATS